MADKKLHLKILTHENVVFDADVDEVYAVGEKGEFGILYNHIPFMSALKIGVTRAVSDGVVKKIATMGGVLQVKDNEVIILTSIAEVDADIDAARAREARERAETLLSSGRDDIDVKRAEIALAKAIARLQAIEKHF